jgi:hypothetical protein
MQATECPECERLWEAYAEAIRKHVRLEYKLRGVPLEGNLDQIQELEREVDAADDLRTAFRENIQLHEIKAHAKSEDIC